MDLREYPNLPRSLGVLISSDKATLVELQSVLSVEDVYLVLEVITTDAANRELVRKRAENR